MIGSHRTAFPENSRNLALEYNLDKVVHMTSQKLKDMVFKKQEATKENNLLKGQFCVLESDIQHIEKELLDREDQIRKMIQEHSGVVEEIKSLEQEYDTLHEEYKKNSHVLRSTVVDVKNELDSIKLLNRIEDGSRKSEMKKELEMYLEIKESNGQLMDQLYELRRNLYYIDVLYKKESELEMQRIYKTKKGIESINKMFYDNHSIENEEQLQGNQLS